jgi:hypothetical protein
VTLRDALLIVLNELDQKKLEVILSQMVGATHMAEYEADSFKVTSLGPAYVPKAVYEKFIVQQPAGEDPRKARNPDFQTCSDGPDAVVAQCCRCTMLSLHNAVLYWTYYPNPT